MLPIPVTFEASIVYIYFGFQLLPLSVWDLVFMGYLSPFATHLITSFQKSFADFYSPLPLPYLWFWS